MIPVGVGRLGLKPIEDFLVFCTFSMPHSAWDIEFQ